MSNDPALDARVRAHLVQVRFLAHLGATPTEVAPGRVRLQAPITPALTQQQGLVHAGVSFAIADSAMGAAALSQMPEGREVVSVEVKINLLRPARGEVLEAEGEVLRAGRQISVVRGLVWTVSGDDRREVAALQGTMMAVDA